MYDISHAPFLRRSQCRFKREVQNDHPGDGCTAPPAPWSWRWRDCTMHTSREWHQWSLRWHSIAAKCIGDFLYRLWTSDSPEKRSIELRAEVRWVRRPPKRTQRPLRSACLRTGISQLRDRLPHRMRRCTILLKPNILSVLPACLLSYDMW